MINLPTVPSFDAGSNPSKYWRLWKQDFEDYLEAKKCRNEKNNKTALFRHICEAELKKQLRTGDLRPSAD